MVSAQKASDATNVKYPYDSNDIPRFVLLPET